MESSQNVLQALMSVNFDINSNTCGSKVALMREHTPSSGFDHTSWHSAVLQPGTEDVARHSKRCGSARAGQSDLALGSGAVKGTRTAAVAPAYREA